MTVLPWRPVPIGSTTISTSLTTAEAQALQALAHNQVVLEIGSAYGYSTILMATVADWVTAVDPHQGENPCSYEILLGNLEHEGCRNVMVHRKTSQTFMAHAVLSYGLIFIDGDHAEDTVTHDVTHAQELLKAGGTIACHDYGEDSCPGVKQALDRLHPEGPDRLIDTIWIKGT